MTFALILLFVFIYVVVVVLIVSVFLFLSLAGKKEAKDFDVIDTLTKLVRNKG